MRAEPKASCFLTDGTGPVWLGLVSRMLPTRSELAGTVLRSPLSCLMEYCRSSVSDCLQLCVSTCIQYVSACVLPASCVLQRRGIARSHSPAMRNAPQRGSTSKPLHVHIRRDAHRLGQRAPTKKKIFYIYGRVLVHPSAATANVVNIRKVKKDLRALRNTETFLSNDANCSFRSSGLDLEQASHVVC